MACINAQKVLYSPYMFLEEAEYWWNNSCQRMEPSGTEITWEVLKTVFLEKYFPTDVCSKKEIEFLRLTQGNMIVADYAMKFEELSRLCPHYNEIWAKESKCIKFESGGHISTRCQKPKQEKSRGKVFALSGSVTTKEDILIIGTCFINNISLVDIVDTSATYLFISLDCEKRLNLELSSMGGSKVIDTFVMGFITTYLVCLNCPLSIFDRDFRIDLVSLPLVHINYYAKIVMFPEFVGEEDLFVSAKQVNEYVKDDGLVLMMLGSLDVKGKGVIGDLPICDFPYVFPDDIGDLRLESEMEFAIDLVPDTSPISMAMYWMSASELS
ncbi:uncharacterized protein LOC127097414 [Lathyrus oleraceus]|uniref:uncharacterized protein LOC127097414 n=1 Tax=Pisum sativum TaxID=3888 RepID=UPI0021D0F188|nr:uncharacterized protein LOC127097414 [Pisum sativum]